MGRIYPTASEFRSGSVPIISHPRRCSRRWVNFYTYIRRSANICNTYNDVTNYFSDEWRFVYRMILQCFELLVM